MSTGIIKIPFCAPQYRSMVIKAKSVSTRDLCSEISYSAYCLQASLGLHNDICKRLWQVWDATKADLQPLLDKYHILERRLDSLLILHDINTDGSYHAVFNAGQHFHVSCNFTVFRIGASGALESCFVALPQIAVAVQSSPARV